MMTSMDVSEANELRTGTLSDFWGDFILPRYPTSGGNGTEGKATGKDGPCGATLQGSGEASIDSSSSVRKIESSRARPLQDMRHTQQEPPVYSVPQLEKQVNKNPEWPCLVCTL